MTAQQEKTLSAVRALVHDITGDWEWTSSVKEYEAFVAYIYSDENQTILWYIWPDGSVDC